MKTALLISTYNNHHYLRLCLMTVLAQTVMPDEVVIADDGSGHKTRRLIDEMRPLFSIPLTHVWHEDKGFRLSAIRNKAIAQTFCDYVIQIDGDILLDKNFVKDHISVAKPGYWVSGSRVLLSQKTTAHVMQQLRKMPIKVKVDIRSIIGFSKMSLGSYLNSLRSRRLRSFLRHRYGVRNINRLRGCNMAFFRSDVIMVNGYNEQLTSWGHEDSEFAYRMHFAGVKKQSLKMGGVQFHLYHEFSSKDNEQFHKNILEDVKEHRLKWCDNGIEKHL